MRDMTLEAQFGFNNNYRMNEFNDDRHTPIVAFATRYGATRPALPERVMVEIINDQFHVVDTAEPFWWERDGAD